jgi:uncharacterized protein (TIGR00159 family)
MLHFSDIISSLRWQDIIDIGLNSYILFRLYVLFRGTIVFRVLLGIAILWTFQRLAVAGGFIVSSWIFQGFTAAAALIIIVVFRNEIRNVLQAKNLRTLLWGIPQKLPPSSLDIIIDSAFALAKRRIGALIIIPGTEDLEDLMQKGIQWKGQLSKEMLLSIFWPDNPVHDGAAIIEGQRVAEVGCILPLTERNDLPTRYGTRHRAALGLAEKSDALIIVVSEERGAVSVAKMDQLQLTATREKLEQALKEHLGTGTKPPRQRVMQKLEIGTALFVSFFLITAVWLSIATGLEALKTFEVPVVYVNRDPTKEIISTSASSVLLQLSGPGALIKSIQPDTVQVTIDLGDAKIGQNSYFITTDDISHPTGTSIKGIEPNLIEVNLDLLMKKELPVQVDWVGKMEDRLLLTKARPVPDKLTIIGGSLILEDITTIYTKKVAVDNIEASGSTTVPVILPAPTLKIAPGQTNLIEVEYTVQERSP